MKHVTWILLLLASLAAACDESTTPTPPGADHDSTSIPFEPGPFPNTLGTIWIYRLHNTANNFDDTIEVRITDTVRAPDGHPTSVWTFIGEGSTVETRYVAVPGDTVIFYWSDWPYRPAQPPKLHFEYMFLFPSPVGATWSTPDNDSTIVTDGVSLDVPAGHYDDVTVITRRLANGRTARYWVKPHVGFVKMEDPKSWKGAPREEWTLVRFIP